MLDDPGLPSRDGARAHVHKTPRNRRLTQTFVVFLVFALPASGSILMMVDAIFNGQGNVQGLLGASAAAISNDGTNVYVVGALDDAVVVFERDLETGTLEFLEYHQNGVDGVENLRSPTDVAVSPDGRHVYVTSELDDSLSVFRRVSFGRLGFVRSYVSYVDGIWGIGGASAVTVSPDGTLVLVTGRFEDSLAVFSRSATSDDLVLSDVESSYYGSPGLTGASDVAVSPDGRHVYTTGEIDDAITIFAKDPTQDAIAFVDWLPNGVNGVTGLSGASSITLDKTGAFAFATGRWSDALAVFSRESSTGLLYPETVYSNSQAGIEGLAGASDVTLDVSSELVCVTGSTDDSIVLFQRASDSPELRFTELLQNGTGFVEGLNGASSIAASRDGHHLYVTGAYDDSIVTVATLSNLFFDGFESGDAFRWAETIPMLEEDGPPRETGEQPLVQQ